MRSALARHPLSPVYPRHPRSQLSQLSQLSQVLLLPLLCAGCLSSVPDVWERGEGVGPRVAYDPLHEPFAVAPSPNDAATRYDARSPTGRRLNLSLEVKTAHTREVRRALKHMSAELLKA